MEKDVYVESLTDKKEYSIKEEVKISVTVTNIGVNPVELIFMSAQRYDFMVLHKNRAVWCWSSDRVFGMVLGRLFLKSTGKQTYMQTWNQTDNIPGKYIVIATITSLPAYTATCRFKIKT
jgi:hypothetical protein